MSLIAFYSLYLFDEYIYIDIIYNNYIPSDISKTMRRFVLLGYSLLSQEYTLLKIEAILKIVFR